MGKNNQLSKKKSKNPIKFTFFLLYWVRYNRIIFFFLFFLFVSNCLQTRNLLEGNLQITTTPLLVDTSTSKQSFQISTNNQNDIAVLSKISKISISPDITCTLQSGECQIVNSNGSISFSLPIHKGISYQITSIGFTEGEDVALEDVSFSVNSLTQPSFSTEESYLPNSYPTILDFTFYGKYPSGVKIYFNDEESQCTVSGQKLQCRTIREDELIKVKVYLNGIFYIQNNIVVTLSRVLSLGPVGTTANIEYITKIVYQSYVTIPEGTKVRLTQKDGTIVDQSKTYLLTKMEDNTYQFTVPNNDLKLGVLKVKTLINENDENAEENFLSNINWIVMYYQLSAITNNHFPIFKTDPQIEF